MDVAMLSNIVANPVLYLGDNVVNTVTGNKIVFLKFFFAKMDVAMLSNIVANPVLYLEDNVVNTVTGNKIVFLKFLKMTQSGSYLDLKCSSFREHF